MENKQETRKSSCGALGCIALAGLFVLIAAGIFLPAVHGGGLKRPTENAALQMAHGLSLVLFQYANDHDGQYPVGNSSTEVFQQLVPTYITNYEALYLPLPGKTPARAGQPLQPENVAWDITCPVDNNSPDGLPVVFMTGYKVAYVPRGGAVPLAKPGPRFLKPRILFDWFPRYEEGRPGIAIAFKDMSSKWSDLDFSSGTILNFIDPKVDLAGEKYRQLTPTGSLAP